VSDEPGRVSSLEAAAAPAHIETVVFDLGGVLIDWDPRHLYRQLLDEETMEWFLMEICSPEWNAEQDRGRSWEEAVEALSARHPEWAPLIATYHARWFEMLGGEIRGTVEILRELRDAGVPLLALSNWSTDKFAETRPHYPFLEWFDAIVISAHVGLAKPDPAIFRHFIERFSVEPGRTVYVDDSGPNVAAARAEGMVGIRFEDPDTLRAQLRSLGLPLRGGTA
jgi:2-haloacid dehalogenase